MGNYFTLRDGLITDTSTYGTSLSSAEKINNIKSYTLTTSDSWTRSRSSADTDIIHSLAVHVSGRAATPLGVLSATIISDDKSTATKINITPSADSPFPGVGSSLQLNGTSSYMTFGGSTDFDLSTGDFTVEFWGKFPTTGLASNDRVFMIGTDNNPQSLQLMCFTSDPGFLTLFGGVGNIYWVGNNTRRVDDNQWHHIAVTRAGNSLRLFIDGIQVGSTYTLPVTLTNGLTQGLKIGNITTLYTPMLFSNFRIVKGTALYTVNFPAQLPQAPFEATAGTTFLYKDPYSDTYESFNPETIVNSTYPISSFTSYDGSNNTIAGYPINWQLLKLSSPFNNTRKKFKLNLKTSHPDQLTLMANNTGVGVDYDRMFLVDNFRSTPVINLHTGSSLDGYSTELRTTTASTGNFANIYVHKGGLLRFPNTSTTLTVTGVDGIQATSEGTIQIGSSSTPVPPNITHQVLLSSNHIGASNGGKIDIYGAYKLPYTRFAQDYISGFNNFNTVDIVSSSWRSDDSVIFTPNTTALNTTEFFTVHNFQNANNFVIRSVTTGYPHPALSYVPNVANLTRNVKIGGFSNTAKGNIQARGSAIVNVNNAELSRIDGSLYTGVNSSGSFTVSGCVLSGTGTETLISPLPDEYATVFGGSSYIYGVTANKDINISAGTDFTLEVFIKIDDNRYYNNIFAKQSESAPSPWTDYTGCWLRVTNSKLYFTQYYQEANTTKSIEIVSNQKIAIKKWYHVCVVGSGGKVFLYVNGKKQASRMVQKTWSTGIFGSNDRKHIAKIGIATLGRKGYLFKGRMSNLRLVKGQAMYTSNFTPPTQRLTNVTGSGVSTPILTLQDSVVVDNSSRNDTFRLFNITTELDSAFGSKNFYFTVSNNVVLRALNGLYLDNVISENSRVTNNLLLSSRNAGMYLDDGVKGDVVVENNICVGPAAYGSFFVNNTTGKKIEGLVNYRNTHGLCVSGAHAGQIDNIISTYNTGAGVLVDGNTQQLEDTTFTNITASNNGTLGFLVSGNAIDHLSPVSININGLIANSNLSGGFEGYCICGSLSSMLLSGNSGSYAIKTSLGNYYTTLDGVTALTNNIAGVSAAVGILSGICYYPIKIENSNIGKAVGASVFGAGLMLDSTKFSDFSVANSTVSGGSSDFQLRTSRSILEGSYLISNTNVGVLPVGVGITTSNYQSDVLKTTGFAFTNMNNILGYHVTYLAAGTRATDSTVNGNKNSLTTPSERLTPKSTTLKLRSGSKFVALNSGESTTVAVEVRKSLLSIDGVDYNGSAPRLMLKRNGAVGINSDTVIQQLNTVSQTGEFLKLTGTTQAVTEPGVLEFYVDCDGTAGWINVDNWTAN